MTYRRLPIVVRFRNDVHRAVRSGLEGAHALISSVHTRAIAGRSSRTGALAGFRRRAADDETKRARSTDGAAAALVDPDGGPTSRSEILEYGCLPVTYVRAVSAEHGGRIKQRRFVDEYGWSPPTISRLLSELEQEGAIERYTIGREKVIRLPDTPERVARDATNDGENDS